MWLWTNIVWVNCLQVVSGRAICLWKTRLFDFANRLFGFSLSLCLLFSILFCTHAAVYLLYSYSCVFFFLLSAHIALPQCFLFFFISVILTIDTDMFRLSLSCEWFNMCVRKSILAFCFVSYCRNWPDSFAALQLVRCESVWVFVLRELRALSVILRLLFVPFASAFDVLCCC